jgi:hypothetical protein
MNSNEKSIERKKNESRAVRHQFKKLNKIKTSEPAIVTNLQRIDNH